MVKNEFTKAAETKGSPSNTLLSKPPMDYFDTRIGLLEDPGSPDGLQFAAALLRHIIIYFYPTFH